MDTVDLKAVRNSELVDTVDYWTSGRLLCKLDNGRNKTCVFYLTDTARGRVSDSSVPTDCVIHLLLPGKNLIIKSDKIRH